MRQRGLQQGDGIQRHAFGVGHLFSFGVVDWLRPMLAFRDRFCDVRGCSDECVQVDSVKKSTSLPGNRYFVTAHRAAFKKNNGGCKCWS